MASWRPVARWLDPEGRPTTALEGIVRAAVAAPSVHNTQPWWFRAYPDSIDVYPDLDRQLVVVDLSGRELMLSVGAATFNLRVAILAHGWLPVRSLWPASGEDGPVARIAPAARVPVSRTVRSLAWAIPRRRTNRGPFKDIPVPATVQADLVAAAKAEGAVLRFAEPPARDALLSLVRTAERYWVDTPAYHEELARWSAERPGRADGIPASAVGRRSARGAVPVRDLSVALPEVVRLVARFEHDPAIAVLYTGDTPAEWLRAGEALQRVLLTATARGLATTLMTQPTEVPRLRALMGDRDTGRAAQAIIRFGYARLPAAPSPRRPVADVLRSRADRGVPRPGPDAVRTPHIR